MSKRNRNSRFAIPSYIAYSTPVYIHSHQSSLLENSLKTNSELQPFIIEFRTRMKNIREESNNQAKAAIDYLSVYTQTMKDAGFDPNAMIPAHIKEMSEVIQDFNEQVKGKSFRRNFSQSTKELTDRQDNILEFLAANNEKTISDYFNQDNNIDNVIADYLQGQLMYIINKKDTKKVRTLDEVKNMTGEELKRLFNGRKDYFSKELQKEVNTSRKIKECEIYWNNFLKSLESVEPILQRDVKTGDEQEIDKLIKWVNNASYNYKIRLGYLQELISTTAGNNDNTTDTYTTILKVDGVEYQESRTAIGDKGTDASTADIAATLSTIGEKLDYGISIKLNKKKFHMANISITVDDAQNNEASRLYLDYLDNYLFNSQENIAKLRYFLANYNALQVFAVPYDDTAIRKQIEKDGTVGNYYSRQEFGFSTFALLQEIQKSLIVTIFIKALLGSVMNVNGLDSNSNFDKIKDNKPISYVLEAGGHGMWTVDLLQSFVNLTKSDPDVLLSTLNYTGANKNIFDIKGKRNEFKTLLQQLYIKKVQAPSDGITNRYEELYNNSDNGVKDILSQISSYIIGDKELKKMLMTKWSVSYDYSNIQ